jgi:predicted dehydrogenase
MDSRAIGNLMRVLWTWQEFRPESYYLPDPWRGTFRHAGGGVLMSQTSHQLDLICWMLGKPVRLSAFMGNQLHAAEIEDAVCANVSFANGALGSLQFTINQARGYSVRQLAGDRGFLVVQDVKSLGSDENDEILLGTYGDALPSIITQLPGDGDQPELSWRVIKPDLNKPLLNRPDSRKPLERLTKPLKLLERIGCTQPLLVDKHSLGHSVLMNSFIDAILNGGNPIVSGESARASVEFINALFISAMRNKTVDLPIDPEEYDSLAQELSDGTARVPMLHQS